MEKNLLLQPFELFDKQWSLLTSRSIDKHNSMTISWGEMGTLWSKPVATVYVKPCRFAHEFMENYDYFVLSFFEEKYRQSLAIMGSKSGRDVNKDFEAKLTPIKHDSVTIYQEASLTLICKKIYQNDLIIANIPQEEIDHHYSSQAPYTMYIGEVIEIIK